MDQVIVFMMITTFIGAGSSVCVLFFLVMLDIIGPVASLVAAFAVVVGFGLALGALLTSKKFNQVVDRLDAV